MKSKRSLGNLLVDLAQVGELENMLHVAMDQRLTPSVNLIVLALERIGRVGRLDNLMDEVTKMQLSPKLIGVLAKGFAEYDDVERALSITELTSDVRLYVTVVKRCLGSLGELPAEKLTACLKKLPLKALAWVCDQFVKKGEFLEAQCAAAEMKRELTHAEMLKMLDYNLSFPFLSTALEIAQKMQVQLTEKNLAKGIRNSIEAEDWGAVCAAAKHLGRRLTDQELANMQKTAAKWASTRKV